MCNSFQQALVWINNFSVRLTWTFSGIRFCEIRIVGCLFKVQRYDLKIDSIKSDINVFCKPRTRLQTILLFSMFHRSRKDDLLTCSSRYTSCKSNLVFLETSALDIICIRTDDSFEMAWRCQRTQRTKPKWVSMNNCSLILLWKFKGGYHWRDRHTHSFSASRRTTKNFFNWTISCHRSDNCRLILMNKTT